METRDVLDVHGGPAHSVPVRLSLVGSEKLGPLRMWLRWKADRELTPEQADEIKKTHEAVYHTALRSKLLEAGIVLDENNDIIDVRPDVLEGFDLSRLPPGSEDDPEVARTCATIRALKDRNAKGGAAMAVPRRATRRTRGGYRPLHSMPLG